MRSIRVVLCLMVVAFFAACISEPTANTLTNAEVAGTYTLRSVNGSALPAIVQQAVGTQPRIEVLSDQITVGADGNWSGVEMFRVTTGTTVDTPTVNSGGTYSVSGSQISFRDSSDGSVFSVSVSGDAFLLTDGVSAYLYSR